MMKPVDHEREQVDLGGGRLPEGCQVERVYDGEVGDAVTIDISELRKQGAFATRDPALQVSGQIRWKRQGRPGCASFTVETDASGRPLNLVFDRKDGGTSASYTVGLVTTQPNLGGERWWFTCPLCQRRCAKLHLSGRHFACRCCAGLTYRSVRQTTRDRLIGQARKVESRLGPGLSRPPGMRKATYERLLQRARAYRNAATTALMRMKTIQK